MTIGDELGGYTIEAFVSEQDIKQLGVDDAAVFYPENPNLPPLKCRLQQIDDGSSVNLPNLLASTFGGPIATRVDQNKKNVPESEDQHEYRRSRNKHEKYQCIFRFD